MIIGDAGEPHAWNIAGIDGVYYLLDPTFDVNFSKTSQCKYFMLGTEDFDDYNKSVTHVPMTDIEPEYSALEFDYQSESFLAEYPVSTEKFSINNRSGDVNADGLIDAVDASMVLSAYATLSTNNESGFTTVQEILADVNNDEEINAVDSSLLLQYYAYISTIPEDEEPIEPEIFFKKEVT